MIELKISKYDSRTTIKPLVKVLVYNPMMNKDIENPKEYYGIIDTGSDITLVSKKVIDELFLISKSEEILCNDISGNPVKTNIKQVDILIQELMNDYVTVDVGDFIERKVRINENPVSILIGRDILKNCLTIYDGPAEKMTIEWKK